MVFTASIFKKNNETCLKSNQSYKLLEEVLKLTAFDCLIDFDKTKLKFLKYRKFKLF